MVTVKEIKRANVWSVLIAVLIGGLGLYFALVLSATIMTTLNALLPPQASPVAAAWINLAIALVIVLGIGVLIIIILRAIDPDP